VVVTLSKWRCKLRSVTEDTNILEVICCNDKINSVIIFLMLSIRDFFTLKITKIITIFIFSVTSSNYGSDLKINFIWKVHEGKLMLKLTKLIKKDIIITMTPCRHSNRITTELTTPVK
jgi:hypothetical protein